MCEKCRQAFKKLEVDLGEVVGVRMLVILKDNEGIFDVELHEEAEEVCTLVLAKLNSEAPLKLRKVGQLVPEDKAKEMIANGANLVAVNIPDDEPVH